MIVVEWCSWAQVIWQVDSGARSYLPRLGGGLHSITRSPLDSACYVVSQADNTVRTVSAHLNPRPPPPYLPLVACMHCEGMRPLTYIDFVHLWAQQMWAKACSQHTLCCCTLSVGRMHLLSGVLLHMTSSICCEVCKTFWDVLP